MRCTVDIVGTSTGPVPMRVVKECIHGVYGLLLLRAHSDLALAPVPEPEGLLIAAQAAGVGPHIHGRHD